VARWAARQIREAIPVKPIQQGIVGLRKVRYSERRVYVSKRGILPVLIVFIHGLPPPHA
jgi:putative component of toxin-antitoxin plasmid stabilization module